MRAKTRRRPNHRPESDVLRAVFEYLRALSVWFERRNAGGMKIEGRDEKVRYVQFGGEGMADIFALPWATMWPGPAGDLVGRHVIPLWIETKSSTGRARRAQIIFERLVRSWGHEYLLARSADAVYQWFQQRDARGRP